MRVLVTGASSAIGIAICRKYLQEGYEVIAQYRRMNFSLSELKDSSNSSISLYQCDFSTDLSFSNWFEIHREYFISSDVFIHAAAAFNPKPYFDVTPEDLLYHFKVNVVSGSILLRELGCAMSKRGWGRIVLLGSIGVKFGGGLNSYPYSLSKHSLEFLPRIWREWAPEGVLINTLRVGVTDTPIHTRDIYKNINERISLIPVQRAATTDEIAQNIFYFGSELNTYITGQVISIAGGE